ncbi:MAG: PspA/IM30 family protein [Candidatus Sumerlaeaceae bacterium]|nr:PspA/IM30 family protein [Candidatus Sumerlaeaceae bacterium]
MRLLERVAALIRANVADLLDQSDDPEHMLSLVLQDMNSQLIQVKTAAAQALADEHMLSQRLESARAEAAAWLERAGAAVDTGNDTAARAALERHNSFMQTVAELESLIERTRREMEDFKRVLVQLETRIGEVSRSRDALLARHRRAAALEKIAQSGADINAGRLEEILKAIADSAEQRHDQAAALKQLNTGGPAQEIRRIEAADKLEQQLAQLKARRAGHEPPG